MESREKGENWQIEQAGGYGDAAQDGSGEGSHTSRTWTAGGHLGSLPGCGPASREC